MTFQIGDKVVYPNQGVGTIENISTRSFGSAFEKFYLLRFGCNSMTVWCRFPTRPISASEGSRKTARFRGSFLSSPTAAVPINPDWKVRFKENTDKMQSGDLLQAAEVFKGLLQIHVDKPLSFREKKMLDRARHMLVSEISIARNVPGDHGHRRMLQRAAGKGGTDSARRSFSPDAHRTAQPGSRLRCYNAQGVHVLPPLRHPGPQTACSSARTAGSPLASPEPWATAPGRVDTSRRESRPRPAAGSAKAGRWSRPTSAITSCWRLSSRS